MRDIINDINYFNDPRTQGPAPDEIMVSFAGCAQCGEPVEYKFLEQWTMMQTCDCEDFEYTEGEFPVPSKWEVCPVCHGEGKHVNPSIDCGGIPASEFHDDPDFAECYFGGTYDVTCNRCGGKRVVKVADYEALNDRERQLLEEQERADAEYRAEIEAELRMGC